MVYHQVVGVVVGDECYGGNEGLLGILKGKVICEYFVVHGVVAVVRGVDELYVCGPLAVRAIPATSRIIFDRRSIICRIIAFRLLLKHLKIDDIPFHASKYIENLALNYCWV